MTNEAKYNGWTNYETWNCNLWFDDAFTEDAERILADCDNDKDEAISQLADYIESTVEEYKPEVPNGFFGDIMSAAMREVNFREIAEHYINDIA